MGEGTRVNLGSVQGRVVFGTWLFINEKSKFHGNSKISSQKSSFVYSYYLKCINCYLVSHDKFGVINHC